jgi:hypothetical protein
MPTSLGENGVFGANHGCLWTVDQLKRLKDGLAFYGKQWQKIADYVGRAGKECMAKARRLELFKSERLPIC